MNEGKVVSPSIMVVIIIDVFTLGCKCWWFMLYHGGDCEQATTAIVTFQATQHTSVKRRWGSINRSALGYCYAIMTWLEKHLVPLILVQSFKRKWGVSLEIFKVRFIFVSRFFSEQSFIFFILIKVFASAFCINSWFERSIKLKCEWL